MTISCDLYWTAESCDVISTWDIAVMCVGGGGPATNDGVCHTKVNGENGKTYAKQRLFRQKHFRLQKHECNCECNVNLINFFPVRLWVTVEVEICLLGM